MSATADAAGRPTCPPGRSLLGRFLGNRSGTAAIEMGIVIGPFLLFVMGVIIIGLNFLTVFSLENAVEKAARQIRTGQAQQGDMTASQFKQLVCDKVVSLIECEGKLQIHVQSWPDFDTVSPTACLGADGALAGGSAGASKVGDASGGASQVVLVTACYESDLLGAIPMVNLGNMASGARLVQAAVVFRTEPFQ